MTVRVNKPAINVREKLAELDYGHVPYHKMPAGSVIQVANAYNATPISVTASSYTNSGLSGVITPKFSNSKIMIVVNMLGSGVVINSGNDAEGNFQIIRGSTPILTARQRGYDYGGSGLIQFGSQALSWLDSPATTSATTYTLQMRRVSSTGNIRMNEDSETGGSSITLMEIAQ
jgi:hypothetical protein